MTTRNRLQLGIYKIINPLVKLLIRAGLTPNMVTTIGLILNIGVTIIFISGAEEGKRGDLSYVGWAGALILFAGLFDMLDGQVARLGNMSSRFGALYDSVLDRYSEMILFLGICYYLVAHHYFLSSIFAFVGLIGSVMVSYTRARAEGLGIECKDGLMQRPERVIILGVSALACGIASKWMGGNYKIHWPRSNFPFFETISIFTIPLSVMALLANATAIGRLRDAKKALETQEQNMKHPEADRKKTGEGNGIKSVEGERRKANADGEKKKITSRISPPGALSLLYGVLISLGLSSPAQTTASRNGAVSGAKGTKSGTASPGSRAQSSEAPASPTSSNGGGNPAAATRAATTKAATTEAATATKPAAATAKKATDPEDDFPVPPQTSHSLFYLQRTPNANTIICELNEKNGIPDKEDPVHVLWIRYTEQRQRQELNWIQRTFAYGIKSRDMGNDTYELRFVSYKQTPLYLKPSPVDHRYHVYATIAGRQAILNRIFIKINPGGTFWSPNVEYLELRGIDTENGQEIMQRIKIPG
jgi:phosphatidylglycerophosphate synthase